MNKVILMGRLTRDPDIRYSAGENSTAVARYTLAVDRRFRRDGEQTADFISCVAFGRTAEFAEKYFHQGIRIVISGRIQTGSYTNRDGVKVYTTDVVVGRAGNSLRAKSASAEKQRAVFGGGLPSSPPGCPLRLPRPCKPPPLPRTDFMNISGRD